MRRVSYIKEKGVLMAKTGEDLVIISGPAFRAIFQQTISMLNTGAFVIWYHGGKRAGSTDGKALSRLWEAMPLERFMEFFADTYSGLGWGLVNVDLIDIGSKRAAISIKDNPFVRHGERSSVALCHFIRGFLEGVFEEIVRSSVKCNEAVCQAQGGEACRFEITWS